MEDFQKQLENGIISLFDKFGNEVKFEKKELKYYKAKYSSAPNPTLTLFIDDKPLVNLRHHQYHVEYECSCGNRSKIHLSKYLAKTKLGCQKCRENDEKIAWHKKYFEMKKNGEVRGNKGRKKSKYDFNSESDEFKEAYFKRNLTEDEFNDIKHLIYSIGDITLKDKSIEFLVAWPCHNAKKYAQYLRIDGKEYPLQNVNLICSCCGEIFHITRQLKEHLRNNSFYCKACVFNNFSFSMKKHECGVTYQSNEELKFIDRCLGKNIKIENGLKIPYFFENRLHVYNSDYFLPERGLMIEIKDNHVWHRKQVESGKWGKKEKAARLFAKEHGYEFYLLFPNDIDAFFNTYERNSLNTSEN